MINQVFFFNVELLKDSSQLIEKFLKDNPNDFHYHLNFNDKNNFLRKLEKMFQGAILDDKTPKMIAIIFSFFRKNCKQLWSFYSKINFYPKYI